MARFGTSGRFGSGADVTPGPGSYDQVIQGRRTCACGFAMSKRYPANASIGDGFCSISSRASRGSTVFGSVPSGRSARVLSEKPHHAATDAAQAGSRDFKQRVEDEKTSQGEIEFVDEQMAVQAQQFEVLCGGEDGADGRLSVAKLVVEQMDSANVVGADGADGSSSHCKGIFEDDSASTANVPSTGEASENQSHNRRTDGCRFSVDGIGQPPFDKSFEGDRSGYDNHIEFGIPAIEFSCDSQNDPSTSGVASMDTDKFEHPEGDGKISMSRFSLRNGQRSTSKVLRPAARAPAASNDPAVVGTSFYQLPTLLGQAPAAKMGQRLIERLSAVSTPGPGAYEPLAVQRVRSATMGVPLVPKPVPVTPGPGHYSPVTRPPQVNPASWRSMH